MKILMTGANGYVGGGLMKYLRSEEDTVIPVGFDIKDESDNAHDLDLTDLTKTSLYLKDVRPDVIIHLAGNKDVSRCESDKAFSRRINYEVSRNIVEQCLSKKIRLIYISTDYVFNGVDVPFNELSHPRPATQYGKDKLAAEDLIRATLSDHAIIRTAGIFGLNKDFVETVIKTLKQRSKFQAYTNLKNSPTFIKDLSLMLHAVIIKRHIGTFHCAGSESISRYDFAVKVSEAFGLEKSLVVPACLDTSSDIRPPDLSMDCISTYRTLGCCPKRIGEILRLNRDIWMD